MSALKVKLLVVQGRPQGKFLVFAPGSYYFGRGDECQVRPNSPMVSRQHCLLRVSEAGVFLRDLGSRHGTLVNGALIHHEQKLKPGDQIQIGPLVFELQLETLVAAPAASTGLVPPPTTEPLSEFGLPNEDAPPNSTEDTKDLPSLDAPEEPSG